ncbi:vasotab [Musca domestica]|uniref:Vasotab n=1 Tax=Musca domestica TaxID=7370 RepID=A0A1I8NEC9_MUSDO|nr:vasotab [Musca domestica]
MKMASSKWIFTIALFVIVAAVLPNVAEAQRGRPGRPGRPGQGNQGAADCPQICPALYSPVCVTLTNGSKMSFSNSCELNVAVCTKRVPGVRSQQPGDC